MLSIQKKYRSFRQLPRRRRLVLSVLTVLAAAVFGQAAFASNITIASPLSGSTATSPLWVKAHNVGGHRAHSMREHRRDHSYFERCGQPLRRRILRIRLHQRHSQIVDGPDRRAILAGKK